MKRFILGLVAVLGLAAMVHAAAPPPLLRTPNTTNISTGLPANSEVPTWDTANNRWDYQLPPGLVNTNAPFAWASNHVFGAAVEFLGPVTFSGPGTNSLSDLWVTNNAYASNFISNGSNLLALIYDRVSPGTTTAVTLDGTNAVLNLSGAQLLSHKDFTYSLTTSNYITFSNLVAGAKGTIWINCSGTPQQVNFSSSYDNFSTNEIAPVFTVTNRAIIAYRVSGTDATNVWLAIKRK